MGPKSHLDRQIQLLALIHASTSSLGGGLCNDGKLTICTAGFQIRKKPDSVRASQRSPIVEAALIDAFSKPHHLDITFHLSLQPAAGADSVQIAIDEQL